VLQHYHQPRPSLTRVGRGIIAGFSLALTTPPITHLTIPSQPRVFDVSTVVLSKLIQAIGSLQTAGLTVGLWFLQSRPICNPFTPHSRHNWALGGTLKSIEGYIKSRRIALQHFCTTTSTWPLPSSRCIAFPLAQIGRTASRATDLHRLVMEACFLLQY
jgi:hypothetical protein